MTAESSKVRQVLLACMLLQGCAAQTQGVCSGTQNGLSTTGNSSDQYNLARERYTGCEIVMGNLEITNMEHIRDFSFLQSIREVTGYILVALNEFSRLPLDHLRVIRGTTLYEDRYALAVMINYQNDGQHGLQELGLTHLTEILEGGVKIIQNKYLSHAPQVTWLDIVKDGTVPIDINQNGAQKPCSEACADGTCWGPGNDTCQILTKTICAPQCNGRCFGRSPSECCHNECAGGCTGPLDTDCFACRNFNNSGSCVPQCPQTVIYNKTTFRLEPNPDAMYQYGSICVSQCPTNFVMDGSSCVSNCPLGKMEMEKNGLKSCEPCGGLCPKVCRGTGTQDRETVDALNIDGFINCTKIQGSLHFLVTGIQGDDYKKVPALDPEKLKIFNTVQEITDILSIQSWPENMTDLSVFSNLQTIQGRSLNRGYSLLVMRISSLTSLGLRSLQRINDGRVYITRNKNLCYYDTVNWTRIFSSSSRPQRRQKYLDIKENRPRAKCVEEGHVCDPLCSSEGCWGPGPDQCLSCNKYSRGGTCVADCMFLMGERREFADASGECMHCHSECKVQEGKQTCTGQSFESQDPGEKGPKVDPRILTATQVRKIKLLGNGVFGFVHKGVWIPEGDTVKLPVAIKTIHDRTGRQTFFEVTDHMLAIGSLSHANVVRIHGICPGQDLQLVSLLSSQGSLLDHVRNNKNKLSPQRLLNWCVQIAKGMFYLEENGMVHRNLAARNVLLKNNYTAQISDYGIADLLYPDDKKYYYNEVKMPIKWMALESILFRRYTHQSDVWSYGVTIWEMMSHGAEPYSTMRPQEVPDLLEKGERLSQPSICTIDVYMVMVKCWMIDENIRPTFKELANEFTRMARDPPRYLVIKEDRSEQDAPPDELAHRSADLDDLEDLDFELEDQGEEVEMEGLHPPSHYLFHSRSLNGLSRLDSHRVVLSSPVAAGYLPMTAGVDNPGQAPWQSRSRLNSARTVSEGFEGCGLEMIEDLSQTGSPKRGRHREDSAYVSQRDSLSGGPSQTPSPDVYEEDLNGYVLPGDSPERETLLCPSGVINGRTGKAPSPGLLDNLHDEEYEYMNKQTRINKPLKDNCQRPKRDKKRTSSVSSQVTACTGDAPPTLRNHDSKQLGCQEVQYEYMDIRKDEGPPAHEPPPPPAEAGVVEEEEEEYVEDSDYHYTNRQPKLRQALLENKELKIQDRDEYEDMDCLGAANPGEAAVYQNMQIAERGPQQLGCGPYVKVRARVAVVDPVSADRSFDNLDYWHSRMLLKTKAMPT
ncbi:receptor tyrosine-protein kinase erbB-3a isoform X2 [Nerophis lumbriciformis]|uniref:receptor tyrosine-protein kinase erbB-3a isoform X2 n=1 Tax=Nerophis lumbriciformis TaxID=546530 RepID=UPI002ADF9628|nr:receptor tyrosine-protein kinase erbB-3-like isoform X2 [Nerophis lumbriciformis]